MQQESLAIMAGDRFPNFEMIERLNNLENLLEQQRTQIRELTTLSTSLSRELSAVQRDHESLCDCLVSTKVVDVTQIRGGHRACAHQELLRSVVNTRRTRMLIEKLVGDRGLGFARLSAASRLLERVNRSTPVAGSETTSEVPSSFASKPPRMSVIHELDENVWRHVRDYEPTPEVLEKWAKSETVHTVFGSFGVESVVGTPTSIRFSDVHKIFQQLGLSLEQFISKFESVPSVEGSRDSQDLEEAANKIMRRFAYSVVKGKSGKEMLRSFDIYRLLEFIGFPLRRFKSIVNGVEEPENPPPSKPFLQIGNYHIRRLIGQGFKGTCYIADHVKDNHRVAVKYPAPREELVRFKDISKAAKKDCIGLPKLVDSGFYDSRPYLVTQLLGSPLTKVFVCLDSLPFPKRWHALKIIGRLVVRRLQCFHECGYVHCDISPGNICLGPANGLLNGNSAQCGLYLIDFEESQKFPGGPKMEVNRGSAEWSSVRSADEVERRPEDDLEALGWVLLSGLFGELPWFEWLSLAYKSWDSKWTKRQVVKQVQRAKIKLLSEGWKAFGLKRPKVPPELTQYILTCREANGSTSPDYSALTVILGGSAGMTREEADKEDLRLFAEHVIASC